MNNMEKTIREWLMELPDGYRERALNNTSKRRLDVKRPTMSEAIYGAFVWQPTREKHGFWYKVNSHYAIGTPLPPLP